MEIIKNCVICNKEFIATRMDQKVCSEECKKKRARELAQERAEISKAEKERRKNKPTLAEINQEARQKGLTYGQLQAMKFKEGLRI